MKWRKILQQQTEIICPYCLKPIAPNEMSREHEPPLSRGGKPGQWIWACKRCNNTKGSLTAEEFAEWKRLEKIRHGGFNDGNRHR